LEKGSQVPLLLLVARRQALPTMLVSLPQAGSIVRLAQSPLPQTLSLSPALAELSLVPLHPLVVRRQALPTTLGSLPRAGSIVRLALSRSPL